ncbi:hypothetical protein PENTCL1PPCAC_23341, partial [Pristionchus entomophagus]
SHFLPSDETVRFWEMTVWRLLLLLFLLHTLIEGAFSGYLRNLLRSGTTTKFPPRKGRPVNQGNGETTGETNVPTEAPETTEGPRNSTIGGSTQLPGTGGTTGPPQPGTGVPSPGPGSTGVPGVSTTSPASTTTRCFVGVWSEWREEMSCNAACGACGTVVRRRSCTTAAAGCPCDGDFRESRPCRISACPYPQPACCPPFTLIYVNGTFACGPQSEIVISEYMAEIAARASTSTRSPTTALIATRPHRTSPGEGKGTTTTTAVSGTTRTGTTVPPSPTLVPTALPGPEPTGPAGTEPTGAPATTQEPERSSGSPVEKTTEGGGEETTAGEEGEIDRRPWYHRLKPMKRQPSDEMETPMWLQYLDIA